MAAGSKTGKLLVWVIMALLIVGLGGFGVSNFGGTLRNIGSVNGEQISTDAYFRGLQQDLNQLNTQVGRPLTLSEATAFGLDGAVRQRLVTAALMNAETKRLGVSVGDENLAKEIRQIPAFRAGAGGFSAEAYRMTLRENGMKEADFEEQLRVDLARGLMQSAIATGFAGSDVMAGALLDYLDEQRSFSMLRLTEADLPEPLGETSEAEAKAFYEANPDAFTRPESRKISYAALLAEEVAQTIDFDEAELRKLYDQRISEFVQPERRLVERLVFQDEAAAEAAYARITNDNVPFETIVIERGLSLQDADMGDVSKAEMGEAGEAIFALTEPGVVGPLPSSLGPALYRMNGILPAEEVSFEAAKPELTSEFALDTARRQIRTKTNEIEDLLAGGAAIEDLQKDAGMTVATLVLEPGAAEGIAGYPKFREQAAKITTADFPELIQLDDGSLAVLRLDEILPPALRPFEEVKDQAIEAAHADKVAKALETLLSTAETGVAAGTALGAFGIVEVHASMPRMARIDAAPASLMDTIFALTEGETRRVVEGDFVALVRLDSIQPADHATPEAQAMKSAFAVQAGQEFGQDVFMLFAQALEQTADIRLDAAAIDAVHAQMR